MKYTIITLNSIGAGPRDQYKHDIRKRVRYEELWHPAFNANVFDPIEGIERRGLEFKKERWGNPKAGELGVWLSNYDRWEIASKQGPLIVFEDDAIPDKDFMPKFEALIDDLPDDWDFAALWIPENQRQDFYYNVKYNHEGDPFDFRGRLPAEESIYRLDNKTTASFVYQGYGMVSLVYSEKGGENLVRLAHERGVDGPVDCWIYQEAHKGNLKGYAPRPECADIVHYDWAAESHVQLTEKV